MSVEALLQLVPTYVLVFFRVAGMMMFAPLFRVERIFLDEPAGAVKSFSQRFEEVVGQPVADYLELETNAANARSV